MFFKETLLNIRLIFFTFLLNFLFFTSCIFFISLLFIFLAMKDEDHQKIRVIQMHNKKSLTTQASPLGGFEPLEYYGIDDW